MVSPSWGESPCPPREVEEDSKEGAVSQVPWEWGTSQSPTSLLGPSHTGDGSLSR